MQQTSPIEEVVRRAFSEARRQTVMPQAPNFRMSQLHLLKLQMVADSYGVSPGEFIRHVLIQYLDKALPEETEDQPKEEN